MTLVLSARHARARRACERWLEANDPRGCTLDELAEVAAAQADELGRDLTTAEIAAGCAAVVAAHVHAEEQRAAEEARAGAREEERLAYLARVRARILAGWRG